MFSFFFLTIVLFLFVIIFSLIKIIFLFQQFDPYIRARCPIFFSFLFFHLAFLFNRFLRPKKIIRLFTLFLSRLLLLFVGSNVYAHVVGIIIIIIIIIIIDCNHHHHHRLNISHIAHTYYVKKTRARTTHTR